MALWFWFAFLYWLVMLSISFHIPVGHWHIFFGKMSTRHQNYVKAPRCLQCAARREPLFREKSSGLELDKPSSLSCSTPGWMFSLEAWTSISSSMEWSWGPSPGPWNPGSQFPSLILLLCKMEIILPRCLRARRCWPLGSAHLRYCFHRLALGGDSVWLSFGFFTASACFYLFIASFYWVIFRLILFYCVFCYFPPDFHF